MTTPISLVTGANDHLDNTLVRALIDRGHTVHAGVRRIDDVAPFQGLTCERVPLKLHDAASLKRALAAVDSLYQVGAVFRHWAPLPERDIIQPNVDGTPLILQAIAAADVRNVVYVSSVAAVGHDGSQLDETCFIRTSFS